MAGSDADARSIAKLPLFTHIIKCATFHTRTKSLSFSTTYHLSISSYPYALYDKYSYVTPQTMPQTPVPS